MALVVDASVAIKWFVDEPGADRARSLGKRVPDWSHRTSWFRRYAALLWRKVRLGQAVPELAAEATLRLSAKLIDLRPTAIPASRAMMLALELDHPVYDCFYLALAESEQSAMLTADRRLLARLSRSNLAALAEPL